MSSPFYCALCLTRCTGNRILVHQDPNHMNIKELRKALYDAADYTEEEIEALFQRQQKTLICADHVPNYHQARFTMPRANRQLYPRKVGRRKLVEKLQPLDKFSKSAAEEKSWPDDIITEASSSKNVFLIKEELEENINNESNMDAPSMNIFRIKEEIEINSDNEGIADVDPPGETYFLVKGSSLLELAKLSNVCHVCNTRMSITLRNVEAVPVVDFLCDICKAVREIWDGSEPSPQLDRT